MVIGLLLNQLVLNIVVIVEQEVEHTLFKVLSFNNISGVFLSHFDSGSVVENNSFLDEFFDILIDVHSLEVGLVVIVSGLVEQPFFNSQVSSG